MGVAVFNATVAVVFALGAGAALALSSELRAAGAITLDSVYLVFRYTGMLQQPLQKLTRRAGRPPAGDRRDRASRAAFTVSRRHTRDG